MSADQTSDPDEFLVGRSFLRKVIHDLKNPLAVTLGNIQLIRLSASFEFPPKLNRLLDNAILGCKRQLMILNNLSDFLRFKDSAVTLHPVRFDPVKTIENTIQAFSKYYPERKFLFSEPEATLSIHSDVKFFDHVFQCILENCSCYGSKKGTISISLKPDSSNEEIIISISSSSEKIEGSSLDSLFNPFCDPSMLPSSGRRDIGLMLAFSKVAVEAMNGSIRITDQVEEGILFEVRLPGNIVNLGAQPV